MKFLVGIEDFKRAAKAVQRTSSLALYGIDNGTVLCTVVPEAVTLGATNLKSFASYTIPSSAKEEITFLIPPVALEYMRYMDGGEFEIEVRDNLRFVVQYRKSRATFTGLPADTFPEIPLDNPRCELMVETKRLREALRAVVHASTTEASRFELDGIRMCMNDGGLRFIATDGRRLALADIVGCFEHPADDKPKEWTIPSSFVEEFEKLFEKDDDVRIRIMERGIHVKGFRGELYTLFLRDNFPNVDRILPKGEYKHQAIVNRDETLGILKRCAVSANKETRCADIRFIEDRVDFIVNDGNNTASMIDSLPANVTYAEPLSLRFNVDYVMDAIMPIKTDQIMIYGLQKSPLVIYPVHREFDRPLIGQAEYIQVIRTEEES